MAFWSELTSWGPRELCVKSKYPSMDLAAVRNYLARYPTVCSELSDREKANIAIAKAQAEARRQTAKPTSAALAPLATKGGGVDFSKGFSNISTTLAKPVQLPGVGGVPMWMLLAGAGVAAYLLLFRKRGGSTPAGTP